MKKGSMLLVIRRRGEKEKAVEMLGVYEKPFYIYLGERDRINEAKFENECFDKIFQEGRAKIYKVVC